MTRFLVPFVAFAALVPLASAGIKFKSPKAGATLTAGTAIMVEWEEGGTGPKISDLLTYELFLCGGGNTEADRTQYPITTTGNFVVGGNKMSGMIPPSVGEDTKNAYYLKMIAVAKAGGQLSTYSDRFSYSGMKGTWTEPIKAALKKVSDTKGPATVDKTASPANADDPNVSVEPEASEFEVDYVMQTGLTRYAPMQPIPPKTVTATNTKPQYPTSSVVIAKSKLPIPDIKTTLTQSNPQSFEGVANMAAAAPMPTDDMDKYLARWKD